MRKEMKDLKSQITMFNAQKIDSSICKDTSVIYEHEYKDNISYRNPGKIKNAELLIDNE